MMFDAFAAVEWCADRNLMLHFPHCRRDRDNFGGSPTKAPLFTNIFPDLRQISAQLWLIFENFSSVRGAAALAPYLLGLYFPKSRCMKW